MRKNIDGKFLDILKSAYSKLQSYVKIDDKLKEYFECTIGTRQGSVASPYIFHCLSMILLITYVKTAVMVYLFLMKLIIYLRSYLQMILLAFLALS